MTQPTTPSWQVQKSKALVVAANILARLAAQTALTKLRPSV